MKNDPVPAALAAAATVVLALSAGLPASAETIPPLHTIPFQEETSPAPAGSCAPGLLVGGGRVHLHWVETPAGDAPALRFSAWDGAGWGAPKTVVSDPALVVDPADPPALIVLADGTLAAAWTRKAGRTGASSEIQVSVSRDGGDTWLAALCPHREGAGNRRRSVSLAPDAVDGFWVAWLDGVDARLRAALWRNGGFGPEVLLDSRASGCSPIAAVPTAEGIAVAYRDRAADEVRDISLVRYERRVWGRPFTLHNDRWKTADCPSDGPAATTRHNLTALSWYTGGGAPQVLMALSDTSAFRVSRIVRLDDGDPLGRTDVDWLPDDSAVASWVEKTPEGAVIRARRVTFDGRVDPAVTLASTTAAPGGGIPQLAVAGVDIWLAWTDVSAAAPRVRVGRLDLSRAQQ